MTPKEGKFTPRKKLDSVSGKTKRKNDKRYVDISLCVRFQKILYILFFLTDERHHGGSINSLFVVFISVYKKRKLMISTLCFIPGPFFSITLLLCVHKWRKNHKTHFREKTSKSVKQIFNADGMKKTKSEAPNLIMIKMMEKNQRKLLFLLWVEKSERKCIKIITFLLRFFNPRTAIFTREWIEFNHHRMLFVE